MNRSEAWVVTDALFRYVCRNVGHYYRQQFLSRNKSYLKSNADYHATIPPNTQYRFISVIVLCCSTETKHSSWKFLHETQGWPTFGMASVRWVECIVKPSLMISCLSCSIVMSLKQAGCLQYYHPEYLAGMSRVDKYSTWFVNAFNLYYMTCKIWFD